MKTREELLKTNEYWFETIQNDIYRIVSEYIEKEGMNKTQFADKLGVSKGYVSQILNGDFNATLKKLIELSLAVDVAPAISFKNLHEYISEDKKKRFEMQYTKTMTIGTRPSRLQISSGALNSIGNVKASSKAFNFNAA